MTRVLAIAGYFAPGFRGGGGVRHLINIVDRLGEQLAFSVLTRDRDLGTQSPYDDVPVDTWTKRGTAHVCYLTPAHVSLKTIAQRVREAAPDVMLLNSVFSTLAIRVLLLRRWGALPMVPVLLACQGEFSPGALRRKRWMKQVYWRIATVSGMYRGVTWKASTAVEADEIQRAIGADTRIAVVPEVIPERAVPDFAAAPLPKERGRARLIYLSRITPSKNLRFLLEVLALVTGAIELDIVGPLEDRAYWRSCEECARRLPPNVSVRYRGESAPDDVPRWYARAHVAVLPTLAENFGFAILEALACARPVLISTGTPWRNLQARQAGWDLPLTDSSGWRETLETIARMDAEEYARWSHGAWSLARAYAESDVSAQKLSMLLEQLALTPPHTDSR